MQNKDKSITQRSFEWLKDHKEEAAVVGGLAFFAGATILTKKRLLQANPLQRYTAWQAQKGGGHLVVMSAAKQPTLFWTDMFDWSKRRTSISGAPYVVKRIQTTMPGLKCLDVSFPYIGHGADGDFGVSADAALGRAHVAVSMDYLDKQHGLLSFNIARQAYRIENSHFIFNQGVGVLLNTGLFYGAIAVSSSVPQALVFASFGVGIKKMVMGAINRYQNAKADDAAISSASDFALEQQFERTKAKANSELRYCKKQENTFLNRQLYRVGGLFSHHQHAVPRAIKFGEAHSQRQQVSVPSLDDGETKSVVIKQ